MAVLFELWKYQAYFGQIDNKRVYGGKYDQSCEFDNKKQFVKLEGPQHEPHQP